MLETRIQPPEKKTKGSEFSFRIDEILVCGNKKKKRRRLAYYGGDVSVTWYRGKMYRRHLFFPWRIAYTVILTNHAHVSYDLTRLACYDSGAPVK